VEVVLMYVCFYIVAKMSDWLLEQQISIKFCLKLSLEIKNGSFTMIPKANKVCSGNSHHPYDPRELACQNHK
jgi:hypothetical protein